MFQVNDQVAVENGMEGWVPAVIVKILDNGVAYSVKLLDGTDRPRDFVPSDKVRKMTKEDKKNIVDGDELFGGGDDGDSKKKKKEKKKNEKNKRKKEKKEKEKEAKLAAKRAALAAKQEERRKKKQREKKKK